MAEVSQICIARILNVLEQGGKRAVPEKALYGRVKGKKISQADFRKAAARLAESGDIMLTKQDISCAKLTICSRLRWQG